MAGMAAAALAALDLAGCGAGSPGVGEVASLGFIGGEPAKGSPADAYVRIARGAKSCWFGPAGPLQDTHLFVGELQPESKGGNASIVLYEAEADGKRGLKAFTIEMAPKGEGTVVTRANERIPEPFAGRMLADVDRWADGEPGCAAGAAGWAPVEPQSAPSPQPAGKPRKKSTST
jgi:hypothetical protein